MRRLTLALLLLAACRCASTDIPREMIGRAEGRSVLVSFDTADYCSGVVLQTGYVLTAGHCYGANIKANNLSAAVVKRDEKADLLLLKVLTPDFPALEVSDIEIGEAVFSVSQHAPWTDLYNRGYVARVEESYIATSLLGVPGFSGSAVYSKNGALVGIVSQMNAAKSAYGVVPMYSWSVSGRAVRKFLAGAIS